MKKTLPILCFLILVMAHACFSQKNRPVVSDVIALMEILRTDYSLIDDPNQRNERLILDRKRVISVLKNYVQPEYARAEAAVFNWDNAYATLSTARNRVKVLFEKIQYVNGLPVKDYLLLPADERKDALATDYLAANTEANRIELTIFSQELHDLMKATRDNWFMQDMLKKFDNKFQRTRLHMPDLESSGYLGVTFQKSGPLVAGGALTFTEAIDGLSKFIVKRIKEELASQVFEQIRTKLSGADFEEFCTIFPKTTKFLIAMQAEEYPRLLNSLKEHIREDLDDLLANLPAITALPRVQVIIAANPGLEFVLEGFKLIQQLQKVDNPAEVIFLLENSPLISRWLTSTQVDLANLANGIKVASLITNAMITYDGGNLAMISAKAWKSYANNLDFYALFLALLYQQDVLHYNIRLQLMYDQTVSFADLVNQFKTQASCTYTELNERVGKKIEALLYETESLANQFNEIKRVKRQGQKVGTDTLTAALNSSIDAIHHTGELAMEIVDFFNEASATTFQQHFNNYILYAKKGVDIYGYIAHKSYVEAATYSLQALTDISRTRLTRINSDNQRQIIKFTDFLISSAKAETSDDFEAAIENFALPSGSSSIKRKSLFNVAVNSYPGFFISRERLRNIKTNRQDTLWAWNAAFTVPVGISASLGTRKAFGTENDKSLSLFLSVIDIGAITSFRFEDNESEIPKFDFRNIFAPGAQIIYGFRNSPISLGGGIQFGPTLREVSIKNKPAVVSSFRIGATLTIDLPIINLYTNNRE